MRAFSLIELLLVVVLLGILAAIVFPNFHSLTQNSKTAEAKTALAALYRKEQSYFFVNGEYSTNLDKIGFYFEPNFYLIGFSENSDPSDPSAQIHRGPAGVTPLHRQCKILLTPLGFRAGSSNDEDLTNFRINHKGCLRELKEGSNNCDRPVAPKVCI